MFTEIFVFCLAAYYVQYADGAARKTGDVSPIVYPGPIKEVTENRYGSPDDDVPPQCRNQNYCTVKPHGYPQERFNQLFKGAKPLPQPTLIISEIGDRQGDPDEHDGCESDVTYEPLYRVRTKRGDWRTVVQAPEENYVQMVRLEICNDLGASCFTDVGTFPGITTLCKQKTSTWEFLVDNGRNGTERVKAELPVCCSCHYKIV
ncbi:uncharacterized protein LOC113509994 [Galleria mellonella]|uniref:Uncharacterized protein LOC113509994 n=1 Tax=Galleria mellonella TaxID=7137 RepID=A0A6J1WGG5_GALME|nr:uncharacterized protein LOC113509994 [Galleria mellonella]